MSVWLHDKRFPEVIEYLEKNDMILLPVGSVEQHGPHLPLKTDASEAIDVAEEIGRRTGILVASPIWYGWTPQHMGFPGTVTLRSDTLIRVIEDVCNSLIHGGFKKIFIINGHRLYNLNPLEIASVKVRIKTNAYVSIIDVALVAVNEITEICNDTEVGAIFHGGVSETSFMLYKHNELCDMSKAEKRIGKFVGDRYRSYAHNIDSRLKNNAYILKATYEEYKEHSDGKGSIGDPTLASKERGKQIFEVIVKNAIEVINNAKSVEVEIKETEVPV